MSADRPFTPRRVVGLLALAACCMLPAWPCAAASTWSGVVLRQDPAQDNDQFGAAVAVSNTSMVIGAPGVGPVPNGVHVEGAAYFYAWSGGAWRRIATFTASDGDPGHGDAVGQAVAIDGGIAVVGAPDYRAASPYDHADGVAYVYRRVAGTWMPDATLTAPGNAALEAFGCSVAVDDGTVVVGSCLYDNGATPLARQRGAVFVYTRGVDGWAQAAVLSAPDAAAYDSFGTAVAIDGDTIVAGAPHKNIDGNDQAGAAYVFTRGSGGWSFTARLTAGDGSSDDNFGQSVALSGDTVLVGAPWTSNADASGGAVYSFRRAAGAWTQSQRFSAADAGAWVLGLGQSMAMRGNTAIAGAPFGAAGNGSAGAAYVFTRSGNTWSRTGMLQYPEVDGAPTELGWSVALDGPTALAGSLNVTGPGASLVATSSDLIFRDGFQ